MSPFSFLGAPLSVRPRRPPEELGTTYLGMDLVAPLGGGLLVQVEADPGPGRLGVALLSEDAAAPLATAVIEPVGQVRGRGVLRTRALRPGARLWLAVTNLGPGPPYRMQERPAETARGFTARFSRLLEP